MSSEGRAKVLIAVGDADWKYSRGKLRTLIRRLAAEGRFEVQVASHDQEICSSFATVGITAHCLPSSHLPTAPQHSVAMTDLMVRLTRDIVFPDSRLAIWKVMAMDDYLGCVDVAAQPQLDVEPDLLVYPLMGVDNNSTAASRLYSSLLLRARRRQAGIVGLEVSPLGNKQTLGASLADSYALKSDFSRSFVVREEIAPADRTFVLPAHESYLLTCREDAYLNDFFVQETSIRRKYQALEGRPVILVPHHVAFVYEIRQLLGGLKALRFPFTVILRTDPHIARQGLKEKDIARKVYGDEIAALPQVIIDDEGGWLWPLLLADAVVAPAHSVFTELAVSYGKFTAICQGWGDSALVGDHHYVEPRPDRALPALASWMERKVLGRRTLSAILSEALERKIAAPSKGVADEY